MSNWEWLMCFEDSGNLSILRFSEEMGLLHTWVSPKMGGSYIFLLMATPAGHKLRRTLFKPQQSNGFEVTYSHAFADIPI